MKRKEELEEVSFKEEGIEEQNDEVADVPYEMK